MTVATETMRIRVVLDLEPGSDPVRGVLHAEGEDRSFDGWMQLAAALEQVRAGAREPATGRRRFRSPPP